MNILNKICLTKIAKGLLITSVVLAGSTNALAAEKEYQAVLEGHVIIPAKTYIKAPDNAPEHIKTSGKFVSSARNDVAETVEGMSNGRPTSVLYPFKGQPIQGHSGIKHMPDGSFWVITDNGAGSKANSPDFMLYLNHFKIDFAHDKTELLETIFLHDPDKKVPFLIVNEASDTRYLTGADFDIESFQFVGDNIWIGDEFGPYLIKTDLTGKVLAVFETEVDGKIIHSPDHFSIKTPSNPDDKVHFEVKRSKGFEGMALSADGHKLYPLLEGPIYNPNTHRFENIADKNYLRILEFDLTTEKWTGRHWKYILERNDDSIGDFNMIDDQYGLVIERDDGEGVPEYQCQDSKKISNCFPVEKLPKIKRVYKIQLNDDNVNHAAKKIGFIDLLNIKDPSKKSKKPYSENKFVFPFMTIENVDIVDSKHIIVGNDNNLPFSSSRLPNQADDNEFILLEVSDFLNAK